MVGHTRSNVPVIGIGDWEIKPADYSGPKELMVELTTKCNLNCLYCFRRFLNPSEIKDMDIELLRKVINEASEVGVKRISLSGWGEPLTYPHVLEAISMIKSKGMEVLLNTNGTLLKEFIEDIHRLRVDYLVVSVDAPEQGSYGATRRGGKLLDVVTALKELKELRMKGSPLPDLRLQLTLTKLNYGSLSKVIELAKDVGASHVIVSNVIPLSPEMRDALACYASSECLTKVRGLVKDIVRASLLYGVNVSLPKFTFSVSERSCPFTASKAAFVRADGLVTPCIYYSRSWVPVVDGIPRRVDPVIFGDLRSSRLRDVWFSEPYVRFRAVTYFMHMPSCLDCPLREYCTLTLTNEYDCWGNSPTCAHCPYSRDLVRCPL